MKSQHDCTKLFLKMLVRHADVASASIHSLFNIFLFGSCIVHRPQYQMQEHGKLHTAPNQFDVVDFEHRLINLSGTEN